MPTERSRARRERRFRAVRRPVTHVVAPGLEVGRATAKRRETIAGFLARTNWATLDPQYGWQFRKGLPTIIEVNGEAVLRREWRKRRIRAEDTVRFVSFPAGGGQGGGAKQILGLVALVAISAFAIWAGPALFGAGTFGAYLTTAAIGIGGSLLVSALTAPKPGATNAPDATTDQIYSAQASGNAARLGQPLPVWYGRLKCFPEFAAVPWAEFVGNDQYINVLLSTTMGSLDYEALYIDDTIMWTPAGFQTGFESVQVAFYEPGETVTLFPTNVTQASEVTGQQLPNGSGTWGGQYTQISNPSPGAWVGPFVANPAGTLAQSLAIDYVMPSGAITVNENNADVGFANIALTAQYAPCDDQGVQIGPFVTLFSIVKPYNLRAPIRDTMKIDVSPGRYLVRLRRDDAELDGKAGTNAAMWAGLRAFIVGNASFPDVSTVAIRIKADLSTQGAHKFGVLATRKLPVWDGSSFALQPTRSPAWAFYDAVTNQQYGAGLSPGKTDINAVLAFDAGCTARGDTFDYRFNAAVTVPEALDKTLTAARARHFWLGDTVSVVRDEWRDVPTMLLTDREIVRDSTQVSFTMLGEEDPDAVTIEYIDENTWLPAQVQYPADSPLFIASSAEPKRIDGIVNRDQAYREAAFYYLQSIYRRESVQIDCEYEGRAITFGSVLRLQSELPEYYGYGGAVIDVADNVLTLDPVPTWDAAPFYIRLRMPNGKSFGPVKCEQGGDASRAVLDTQSLADSEGAQNTTLAAVLTREDGGEFPSFEFGTGVSQSRLCTVLSGAPNGDHFTLSLIVDDARVHATDLGNPETLPGPQFPSNDSVPLILWLWANFGQGIAEPKLSASWLPAPGAQYYVADVSYDEGSSWIQVYEGADNKFSVVVSLAALTLRVQAIAPDKLRGPYATFDVSAPTITIADNTVVLQSFDDSLHQQVTTVLDSVQNRIDDVDTRISALVAIQEARNWTDQQRVRTQLAARSEYALAQIEDVRTVALATDGAMAQLQTTVTAQFNGVQSQFVTVQSEIDDVRTATSTTDAALAQYKTAVTAQFNGVQSQIDEVRTAAATTDSALTQYKTTVSSQFAQVNSSVNVNAQAITRLDGYAQASYGVMLDVNGFVAGTQLVNGGVGTSSFTVLVDKFQIALPGVAGGAAKPVFTIGTINGQPATVLSGNVFADGSITVAKLDVAYLSAISANLGTVTAGMLQSPSGAVVFNLNEERFEVWS